MTTLPIRDAVSLVSEIEALTDAGPFALAAVDVDEMMALAARYGHSTGDGVIAKVYESLVHSAPDSRVFRIGADEFLCTFPGASPEHALFILESLRQALARPSRIGDVEIPVHISAGIASFPHHGLDASELSAAAEEALQKAKSEGRGRVVIYIEEKMVLKSNYYSRGQLGRLGAVARALHRTEASVLREALDTYLETHRHLV